MKTVILYASIILASGILLVNIYNSLVDAKNWGANIPQSLETARAYFSKSNPGDFFRIFTPLNQVIALVVLILFWKSPGHVRLYLGLALALYILVDVFTFSYFYPRNDIMFLNVPMAGIRELRDAWSQWSAMNWLRSMIQLAGIIFSSLSLHTLYQFR